MLSSVFLSIRPKLSQDSACVLSSHHTWGLGPARFVRFFLGGARGACCKHSSLGRPWGSRGPLAPPRDPERLHVGLRSGLLAHDVGLLVGSNGLATLHPEVLAAWGPPDAWARAVIPNGGIG